jgi:peroxiredoxin
MPLTESTMLPLGTLAPDFALTDVVSGRVVQREEFHGQPLLVMFICAHCPFVQHINKGIAALGIDYEFEPIAIVAISSNDAESHPEDAPEMLREQAFNEGFLFPYLYDPTQQVARDFKAACTPEFYLFNAEHELVYRGQFDSSRPGNNIPVTGVDLRNAIDALLVGQPIHADQKPGVGCNIKWKS